MLKMMIFLLLLFASATGMYNKHYLNILYLILDTYIHSNSQLVY